MAGTGKESADGQRTAINAAVQVAAHLIAERELTEHLRVLVVKAGPKVRYEMTTSHLAE